MRLTLLAPALLALSTTAAAGVEYQVTITGTVDFNSISSGELGSVSSGQPVELVFRVDSDDFFNSPNFPTRGYFIDEDSWKLRIGNVSVPLQNPYSGFGAMFVLRNDDPAVDGFLVSDNVDFPVGVPTAIPGQLGAFEHAFSVTYGGATLSSLDIAGAVGTYDFTGLTVFNWTIEDGPFAPLGLLFAQMVVELAPPLAVDGEGLSLLEGGTRSFTLEASSARANWWYWLFGSFTGTSPGLDFGGGLLLPLNFDAYMLLTINKPGLGAFGNFLAQLDADGQGTATLTFPPGVDPTLAGVTLHHAYLAAEVLGMPTFASNAVPILLVP